MAKSADILQHSDGSDGDYGDNGGGVGDDGDNDGDADADYMTTASCNIGLMRMNIS